LFAVTLDNPENRFLTGTAGSLDLPLADMTVHVLGEPSNESLVCFNLATHFSGMSRFSLPGRRSGSEGDIDDLG
jgi:hypothetical protein